MLVVSLVSESANSARPFICETGSPGFSCAWRFADFEAGDGEPAKSSMSSAPSSSFSGFFALDAFNARWKAGMEVAFGVEDLSIKSVFDDGAETGSVDSLLVMPVKAEAALTNSFADPAKSASVELMGLRLLLQRGFWRGEKEPRCKAWACTVEMAGMDP